MCSVATLPARTDTGAQPARRVAAPRSGHRYPGSTNFAARDAAEGGEQGRIGGVRGVVPPG